MREIEWCAAGLRGGAPAIALSHMASQHQRFILGLQEIMALREYDSALRLCAALGRYWWTRDYLEGWDELSKVLDNSVSSDYHTQALVLGWRGRLAMRLGRMDEAAADFRHTLFLAQQTSDGRIEAEALNDLAVWALWGPQQHTLARSFAENARYLAIMTRDPKVEADSINCLATIAAREGDLELASSLFDESVNGYLDVGDTQLAGWAYMDCSTTSEQQGHVGRCRRNGEAALTVAADLGDDGLIAWTNIPLSWAYQQDGEFAIARSMLKTSVGLFEALGDVQARDHAQDRLRRIRADS